MRPAPNRSIALEPNPLAILALHVEIVAAPLCVLAVVEQVDELRGALSMGDRDLLAADECHFDCHAQLTVSMSRHSTRLPRTAASFSTVESFVSMFADSSRATCDWEVPIAAATCV
jgi:hypothetical protein